MNYINAVSIVERWEDNIKMDLEKRNGAMDWMNLAQDTVRWRGLVNAVVNLRVL